jgi:hypothetical protein
MPNENDVTLTELTQILADSGLEFYIKKQKDNIVKVHFMVRDEDDD